MNAEMNYLISNIATALIICLSGVAVVMVILFPPTEKLWSQRSFLDKVIRLLLAGTALTICLVIATIFLPNS